MTPQIAKSLFELETLSLQVAESLLAECTWSRPYTGCRESGIRITSFPDMQCQKGVYVIKQGNEIRYIGMSAHCVYKAMYRHFQKWDDRGSWRRVYDGGDPEIIVTIIPFKYPAKLEKALIRAFNPVDNREKYNSYMNAAEPGEVEPEMAAIEIENEPF